jgi:hypothetical protein
MEFKEEYTKDNEVVHNYHIGALDTKRIRLNNVLKFKSSGDLQ